MSPKWLFIFAILNCFGVQLFAQHAYRPFPQHVKYYTGTIKPDHILQKKMDAEVGDFYTQWKKRFIKSVPGIPGTFVWFGNVENKQCVSEGQGYGMIITALMAGSDPSTQNTFDGLYTYYRLHPSRKSPYLMAWAQDNKGKDIDNTSASDGDIDIAYSLLLADKQWGSNGKINYLQQAKLTITAIMQHEINHKIWSVLMSDGIEEDSGDFFDMRSSDFMPTNFKAFLAATGDSNWQKVTDNTYKIFATMQDTYSPDAGLVPDFIRDINLQPRPSQPHYLESRYDGYYNYNACRVPWRIGVDYLLYGDKRAKRFDDKINHWIRETTNNKADNISAGYTLEGDDITGRYFEALSFITPFDVSAMVDKKNQQWLNDVWDYSLSFKMKDFDYYDNSIKMLNMIIISGNYWKP